MRDQIDRVTLGGSYVLSEPVGCVTIPRGGRRRPDLRTRRGVDEDAPPACARRPDDDASQRDMLVWSRYHQSFCKVNIGE